MRRWAAGAAILIFVAGCKLISNHREEDAATTAAPPPPPPVVTANAADAEVTGIPECDTLLTVFSCYMEKSGVADWQLSIKSMRDGFRQAAGSPQGRQTTAAACKMQMTAQQANFARVGCSAPSGGSGSPAGLGGPSSPGLH